MDIQDILQAVVDHLENCLDSSSNLTYRGLMPGIRTVLLGDSSPTDTQQPCVTVDWAGEDMVQTGFGPGVLVSEHELEVNLYIGSLQKGNVPKQLLWGLYTSSSGSTGLRKSILAFPPGSGFALTPLTARRLRPEERPEFRFTAGLQMRISVRKLGPRS